MSTTQHCELRHAFLLKVNDGGQIASIAAYWVNARFYSQLGKSTLQ